MKEFIRTRIIDVDRQRILLMAIGILGMGISLSFLLRSDCGTDPCSYMNSAISTRTGISLGNTMVAVNIILFVIEVLWARNMIGLGTLANMFCIGYICDFTSWLQDLFVPASWYATAGSRAIVFVAALIPFLIFVGFYINADVGVAPYDSIPNIVCARTHLPYAVVRIAHDCLAMAIGFLAGKPLAIATPIMALTLGPVVQIIGGLIGRYILHKS